jgi:hypothetical protein
MMLLLLFYLTAEQILVDKIVNYLIHMLAFN